MRASTNGRWMRQLLPGFWLSALGITLYVASTLILAFASLIRDPQAPTVVVQGAWLVAAFWWPLVGLRVCRLAWNMVGLRLPGIERVLLLGIAAHLLASVGLPLLALVLWQPGHVDILNVAAALWLGSTMGLLIMSLPALLGLLPTLLVALNMHWLDDSTFCAWLAGAALVLSAVVWRWHLRGGRSIFFAPVAVWLESSPAAWATHIRKPGSMMLNKPEWAKHALSQQDVLVAILGLKCQTLRQRYGRRGGWLAWLIFLGFSLAMLILISIEPARQGIPVLSAMMVVYLLIISMQPATRLAAVQTTHRASLYDVYLLPGAPDYKQRGTAIMVQVGVCLAERLALMSLILPVGAAMSGLNRTWLLGWSALVVVAFAAGLASAWLAWNRPQSYKSWAMWMSVFILVGIQTLSLLPGLSVRPGSGWLILAGWLTVSVVYFVLLVRQWSWKKGAVGQSVGH